MDCLPHIHIAAYHASPDYRGDTPGMGVMCQTAFDTLVGAGIFQNSEGKVSTYAAVGWQPLQVGPARLGGYAGAIDGYTHNQGKRFVFAAGLASVPLSNNVILHTAIIPPVKGVSPTTLGFSITVKF